MTGRPVSWGSNMPEPELNNQFSATPNGDIDNVENTGGGQFGTDKDFKEYLLRRMGKGIVQVEITDPSLDDAIKEDRKSVV